MVSTVFTEEEIRVIRALQTDIPLVSEPYRQIAEQIGMHQDRLLEIIQNLRERGCLKRISAALYHNHVGYTINVMIAWDVSEERVEEVGNLVAKNTLVTHCYTRKRTKEFDYNFYSMVHADSEEVYEQLLETLKGEIRPLKFAELRTVRELKKIGMKYFVNNPYG